MPKKAIVASSKGKGIRLALPGPIKQSQSGYESGSSTQQPTQKSTKQSSKSSQSKNEAGSSTQQPKQTKADYAFPIQTLMALQDQGVTKLNKKSWAEICSESDEDIHLTQLISQLAQQKTIIQNPKENFTYFKKTKNFRQTKKVIKKTIQMKMTVSELTLMMIRKSQRMVQKQSQKTENFRPRNGLVSQSKSSNSGSTCRFTIKEINQRKLKQILHLLQEDEELSPNEESDQEDNPNEDDCFGVNLDDD
ncbi:hypothetical protein PIB30_024239 [Stylosanthes scabra]|uniref:Uncharacterized protein n=1 Tax=Stylosanthes scabra TaxID=79078 RepID=A0ABU6TBU1_9FABA|nr:hypothetical protein [Stylosanthes scabra]